MTRTPANARRVCSACFDDTALRAWVRAQNGPRGCWACEKFDSPTAPLHLIQERIRECVSKYYGHAVDQLYYDSSEGGYLGDHWDSDDLLQMLDLGFPRDSGRLFDAIVDGLGQQPWCNFDAGALDLDDALSSSWTQFCRTVKHERRFFFHSTGEDGLDTWTPLSLLTHIAAHCEHSGLIRDIPPGKKLWRARPDLKRGKRARASEFGPAPIEYALQSNRMNPPGIPLLYVASSISTALRETKQDSARIGLWSVVEPLRVLDLRSLPPVPSIFSDATRTDRHALSFLHLFVNDIMKPVKRTRTVDLDYLPSQVVTEFMRDYPFEGGRIDGVAYPSTVHRPGWNVALFLGPSDLGLAPKALWKPKPIKLLFERDQWAKLTEHKLNALE